MVQNWPVRYCVGCEFAKSQPFPIRGREEGTALRCFHPDSPEWAKGRIVGVFPQGRENADTFAPAPVWCGKDRNAEQCATDGAAGG